MEKPKRKDTSTIIISDAAMAAANSALATYGVKVTKKDLVERLLVWFSQQTDVVRGSILEILPPSQRVDIARRELERLAAIPPAAAVADPSIDEKLRARASANLAAPRRGTKAAS
jgi:hypothetical protein